MPVYDRNLLPNTYDSNWTYNAATHTDTSVTFISVNSYASYTYKTTGFEATGYMLIRCNNVSGDVFLCVEYVDSENTTYDSHVIRLVAGIELAIVLQEATVESTITFTLYTSTADSQVGIVEALLMEQAIRSVDIEYASGTSRVTPPEEGWSTSAPQWQTGYYIWQRTATTFVDGHTEYSDPICLQDTESAGIYAIEEQFYLSTSDQSPTGGSWSTTQPTWQTGRYIWTRSQITWTDQSVTYSDPVLAQALNQANERAEEAIDAVEDLDQNLDQDGIFNRLTNNGQSQGLFLDNGDVYINATYINTGILTVRDSSNHTLFRADISSNSVYIAGFTALDSALYSGNRTSLRAYGTGVYIGTDGLSYAIENSPSTYYVAIYDSTIEGGRINSSGTNALYNRIIFMDPDSAETGLVFEGRDFIFRPYGSYNLASFVIENLRSIDMSCEYAIDMSANSLVFTGSTVTLNASAVRLSGNIYTNNIQARSNSATFNVRTSSGGSGWLTITFTNGLMTTNFTV